SAPRGVRSAVHGDLRVPGEERNAAPAPRSAGATDPAATTAARRARSAGADRRRQIGLADLSGLFARVVLLARARPPGGPVATGIARDTRAAHARRIAL